MVDVQLHTCTRFLPWFLSPSGMAGVGCFHPGEQQARGDLNTVFWYLKVATKWMTTLSPRGATWRRQRAMGTSCTRGRLHLNTGRKWFIVRTIPGGTSPGVWWSPHHRRISRCSWAGRWVISSRLPFPTKSLDLGELLGSLTPRGYSVVM